MINQDKNAFTMIEMMVTIAILGIVMSLLASVYVQMAETMRLNTARANALESLTIISNSMLGNLENMATNNEINGSPFSLVGVDGDGKFENSTTDQYPDNFTPKAKSDKLHFFTNLPNNLVGGENATQHFYMLYWIHGQSDKFRSALKERYGLLALRQGLSREDRVEKISGEYPLVPVVNNNLTPLDSVDEADGTTPSILGLYIDYLSFRYYDPKDDSDPWKNSWDSKSKGYFPSLIQFAVRAYDSKVEESPNADDVMTPMWYQSAISLRGRR
jgi:prepilin-type N-terminal cleavage/methylation domain-containing protein